MRPSWKICCFYLLFVLPVLGQAQLADVYTFGGAGNDNGQHLLAGPDNSFYIGGTIDDSFSPLGTELPLYGDQDIFFGQVDEAGNWLWAASAGSFLNDELKAISAFPNGDLLLAGTFWLEFKYKDQMLTATDNIKGIFIIRLDADGNWQWGKVINGSDLKELSDVQIDDDGSIYLTGHFSESIQFDELQLEAGGNNDAYLLKLDGDGDLLDWQQAGTKGNTRGQTIALHPDGGYYWGGIYNDTLLFDTTQLFANTFDPDLFLARFQADGTPLWIKRAGGVFEVDLTDMATDQDGNLYATGFFFGVVSFSDELSIQSRNGLTDIFLFKYDENGAPVWARAVGGDSIDQSLALALTNGELIIGGRYQGSIAWDDLSAPSTEGVSGFVAYFDRDNGAGNLLYVVLADEFAFVEDLLYTAQGQLFAIGSFRGNVQLGGTSIDSPGQYDAFLVAITPNITPVIEPGDSISIKLYPNPVGHTLHLSRHDESPTQLSIYATDGTLIRSLHSTRSTDVIDLSDLPAGTYLIVIQQRGQRQARPIIKK